LNGFQNYLGKDGVLKQIMPLLYPNLPALSVYSRLTVWVWLQFPLL